MRHMLPLVLILLSLALTGTLARNAYNDSGSPIECGSSEALLADASVLTGDSAFGLAPKSSTVSADDVLGSVRLADLRPDETTTYILSANSASGQRVLGFFTPLEGDSDASQATLDLQGMLAPSEQPSFSLIKLDDARFAPSQLSASEYASECGG